MRRRRTAAASALKSILVSMLSANLETFSISRARRKLMDARISRIHPKGVKGTFSHEIDKVLHATAFLIGASCM